MRIQNIGGFIKSILTFHKICQSYTLSPEAEFRLGVIGAYYTKFDKHISKTAAHFGLHRNTVSKYLSLYNPKNLHLLEPKKPIPLKRIRKQIDESVKQRIITLKRQFPEMGKEKIGVLLLREGIQVSASTIGRIFKKYELIYLWRNKDSPIKFKKRIHSRISKKRPPRIFHTRRPGSWIQIDTVVIYYNGTRVYVINAVDMYSRFAFSYAYTSPSSKNAADFLLKLETFFPENSDTSLTMIQTDNGSEFHKYFHVLLVKKEIEHTWSYPKSPKMNALVESFNKTIQLECLKKTDVYLTLIDLNNKIVSWLIHYNTYRPHSSIGYKVPLQVYSSYLLSVNKELHKEWWTCSICFLKLVYQKFCRIFCVPKL